MATQSTFERMKENLAKELDMSIEAVENLTYGDLMELARLHDLDLKKLGREE